MNTVGFRSLEEMRICVLSFCSWATLPIFNPASLPMESYVALRYAHGDRKKLALVEYFYKRLCEYRATSHISPHGSLHPDYEAAGVQAGILANGQLLIRLFEWEWREAIAERDNLQVQEPTAL